MKGKGAGRAPQRMLIVDGYNIINARRSGGMDSYSLADAREKLISDLMDYAGYSAQQVVLVFDAWMSDRTTRSEERHGAVTVVCTQKGEIADRYIERLCDDLAGDIELHRLEVRVAPRPRMMVCSSASEEATRTSTRRMSMSSA